MYVGDAEFTGDPYFTADDPYVPQFDMDGMQLFAEPARSGFRVAGYTPSS